MKITNISCSQFAGMCDKSVSLKSGINVIYGENESGKSSLVNLLSGTLFRNTRLNKKTDKDFYERFFPSKKRNGAVSGDFIDGKISFEQDEKRYILSKEWGEDSVCRLKTPDGTAVKDEEMIDGILREIFTYGGGVYTDLLLSPQYDTNLSLRTILDSSKKNELKDRLSDAISLAFAESGGIPVEKIEKKIAERIAELEGEHWDRASGRPVRNKAGGEWKRGVGEVLTAYYAFLAAEKKLDTIDEYGKAVVSASAACENALKAARLSEEKYSSFVKYSGDLKLRQKLLTSSAGLKSEILKLSADFSAWPETEKALKKAEKLYEELSARTIKDQFSAAKAIYDNLSVIRAEINSISSPTDEEIAAVKNAEREILRLENSLCGMNLNAAIKLLGGSKAEIRTVRTGELIDLSDENITITEAVDITVPDVIKISLSPKSVNPAEIEEKIHGLKNTAGEILKKYNADNLDALEKISLFKQGKESAAEKEENRLLLLLAGTDYTTLEASAKEIKGDLRPLDEIKSDISLLCGGNIKEFIITKQTISNGFTTAYQTMEKLEERLETLKKELEKTAEELNSMGDIPEEFIGSADPDAILSNLEQFKKAASIQYENALLAKSTAISTLNTFTETLEDDPKEAYEKAKILFSEKKAELDSWLHIQEVFLKQKEDISDNPVKDIADKFSEYLGIISDKRLTSDFPEEDKLNMEIYSGNSLVSFDILSEGTKNTVSLAFRLSVLEHLFPEGGGIIVLDDPFTDMDSERTEKACELVKKAAERHQIIFLTCKEEFAEKLGGHLVRMED